MCISRKNNKIYKRKLTFSDNGLVRNYTMKAIISVTSSFDDLICFADS